MTKPTRFYLPNTTLACSHTASLLSFNQDVIIKKHVPKEDLKTRLNGSTKKAGSRAYCNLIERLQDLLEVGFLSLFLQADYRLPQFASN